MSDNRDLLSLFLGFEPADATLPTPSTLSQDLEPLCHAYGLGLAVALDVIVSAEGAGEKAKRHVPGRCDRP